MKAVALVLCLSLPCFGQQTDSPFLLEAGKPAPVSGLLLSENQAIAAAKRLATAEAENASLKNSLASTPQWWVLPVAITVSLLAGFGLGYGIAQVKK